MKVVAYVNRKNGITNDRFTTCLSGADVACILTVDFFSTRIELQLKLVVF